MFKKNTKSFTTLMNLALISLSFSSSTNASLFVSEIHYDNSGADVNERIELSGALTEDLSQWELFLYNGSTGRVYDQRTLSGNLTPAEGCGDIGGLTILSNFSTGIQNGGRAPDGIALINNGAVSQFISYEGSFTAANGPAEGLDSTDIGVFESSSTPFDQSIKLSQGVWEAPSLNTFGICDTEVTLTPSQTPTPTPQPTSTPSPTPTTPPSNLPLSFIHNVQGNGDEVVNRAVVKVEAVVTADFQNTNELSGFFLQEETHDWDQDEQTSEGIFVYCASCPTDVNVGDLVQVIGFASEFNGMSQISARFQDDIKVLASHQSLPNATLIHLPLQVQSTILTEATQEIDAFYEAYEGMLVHFPDTLTVSEYFELARFGQVVLSAEGRPRSFGDANYPSIEGYQQHQIDVASRRVILDDKNNDQNSPLNQMTSAFYPIPGFSNTNFFRGGDTIKGLTGVLHWSFPGSGENTWRLRPVTSHFDYEFTASNPRTSNPKDLGGNLKVASFNVLNYFTDIDDGTKKCGSNADLDCRGAHSLNELARQTDKIVSAICALNADIIGLMEIQNPIQNQSPEPIEHLVDAINQRCGNYIAVTTGSIGTDAITVGMIYRERVVRAIGKTAILDEESFVDPKSTGRDKNRPAIAQSFQEIGSDFKLTVVVNHLKSKGSACGNGDDDILTGQGNCNLTRTLAAEAQTHWLETYPTGVATPNILVIGDLNAYRFEDPITAFKNAGYYDLSDYFLGPSAYGYTFDGQIGYLDYALGTWEMKGRIIDITHWHINADEVNLFDYNDTVVDPAERSFEAKPSAEPLYSPTPYRSSDHDPVIIGIQMSEPAIH